MNYKDYLALTPHHTVVGYTYKVQTLCRACMWDIAFAWNIDGFEATDSTEALLDRAAEVWLIDRGNEYSFDSCRFPGLANPVFPKVITACQVEDEERCDGPSCGKLLCEQ